MNLLQLFVNGLEIDLPTGFTIPVSYSVNEIGNIATREAALSTTLELPATGRNKRVFAGNSYKVLPCEIRELGTQVTVGTVEVESIADTINVRIEAGNASFYRSIDGINLQDLKFYSQSNHIYSLESVEASQQHSWQNVYTYPLTNPGSIRERDQEAGISLLEIFPALYVKRVFVDLVSSLGYYVTGEFLEDALFSSCLMDNGNALRYSNDQLDSFKVKAGISEAETIICNDENDGRTGFIPFDETGEVFGYDFSDAGNHFDETTHEYTVPVDMLLKCTVKIPFRSRINLIGEVLIETQLFINGTLAEKQGEYYTGTAGGGLGERRNRINEVTFSPRLLKQGDVLSFKYYVKKSAALTDYYVELYFGYDSQLLIEAEPYILPGATIDVNSLLPDMSAKDFLLSLANQFCLLFIVNERTKEFKVEKFQKVVSNIPKSENWSDKLDFSESPEETFESDNYGQCSFFSYTATEDYAGDSFLPLLNEKLDKEKTVFESKFASSPKVASFTDGTQLLSVAKYDPDAAVRFGPWIETATYQNTPGLDYVVYQGRYFKSKGNNNIGYQPLLPHPFLPTVIVVNQKWEEVSIVEVLEKLGEASTDPRMFHLAKPKDSPVTVSWLNETIEVYQYAEFELLDFKALLNTYYAGLGTALYAAKYLKLLLHLKPADVKYLDFTRPKYIYSDHVQYGQVVSGYWYVSSVEQYKHGAFESCYVNLVRVVPSWQNELRKAAILNEYNVLGTHLQEAFETDSGDFISVI